MVTLAGHKDLLLMGYGNIDQMDTFTPTGYTPYHHIRQFLAMQ